MFFFLAGQQPTKLYCIIFILLFCCYIFCDIFSYEIRALPTTEHHLVILFELSFLYSPFIQLFFYIKYFLFLVFVISNNIISLKSNAHVEKQRSRINKLSLAIVVCIFFYRIFLNFFSLFFQSVLITTKFLKRILSKRERSLIGARCLKYSVRFYANSDFQIPLVSLRGFVRAKSTATPPPPPAQFDLSD